MAVVANPAWRTDSLRCGCEFSPRDGNCPQSVCKSDDGVLGGRYIRERMALGGRTVVQVAEELTWSPWQVYLSVRELLRRERERLSAMSGKRPPFRSESIPWSLYDPLETCQRENCAGPMFGSAGITYRCGLCGRAPLQVNTPEIRRARREEVSTSSNKERSTSAPIR
jgi:hypothetical protein